MAYKAKFRKRIRLDSRGKKEITTNLYAKFRFRKEIAPKDRTIIRKRITNFVKNRDISENYFSERSNPINHSIYRDYHPKSLSFCILSWIYEDAEVTEMANLNAINDYVLYGKFPDKK